MKTDPPQLACHKRNLVSCRQAQAGREIQVGCVQITVLIHSAHPHFRQICWLALQPECRLMLQSDRRHCQGWKDNPLTSHKAIDRI